MAFLETYGKPRQDSVYDCTKYVPDASGKRCRHYLKGGACSLAGEFMCVEWLKANGHAMPDGRSGVVHSQTDLFGSPAPKPASRKTKTDEPATPFQPVAASPQPPVNGEDRRPLEPIPKDDIDSFKALGVEVCLRSEEIGDVWIVPAYTNQPRRELSIEHAATLCLVVGAFPGSKVVAFEKRRSAAAPEENPA